MSISIKQLPRVGEVMLASGGFPVVGERALLKEALEAMGEFRLGIVCVCDSDRRMLGIVTDGDVRRKLLKVQKPLSALLVDDALKHAITAPLIVSEDDSLREAINLMEAHKVWDLPVVSDGRLVGLLHLHPAVQALLDFAESRQG
jgi:CBS domain-containing protein